MRFGLKWFGINITTWIPLFLRFISKPHHSPFWKAMCDVWREVSTGLEWSVGNGRVVRFLEDSWIPGCGPILSSTLAPVDASLHNKPVHFFVDAHLSRVD